MASSLARFGAGGPAAGGTRGIDGANRRAVSRNNGPRCSRQVCRRHRAVAEATSILRRRPRGATRGPAVVHKWFERVMWGARAGVQFALVDLALKALPVLIIGGFSSIPGAIIGGLIIGATEKV